MAAFGTADVPLTHTPPPHTVSAWLLAGGEGRRMQGQDKGLVSWQGRPLASCVLDSLPTSAEPVAHTSDEAQSHVSAKLSAIGITANRHPERYRELLAQCDPVRRQGVPLAVPGGVLPDDADLPERSGPMAGILTALRHSQTEWVLVLPCDTPRMPRDLWPRLLAAALQHNADIAVPVTQDTAPPAADRDSTRHHWVCALMRRRVCEDMLHAFVNGERKIGRWTQAQPWVGVCFAPETDFQNMNTLETLHGRD